MSCVFGTYGVCSGIEAAAGLAALISPNVAHPKDPWVTQKTKEILFGDQERRANALGKCLMGLHLPSDLLVVWTEVEKPQS